MLICCHQCNNNFGPALNKQHENDNNKIGTWSNVVRTEIYVYFVIWISYAIMTMQGVYV